MNKKNNAAPAHAGVVIVEASAGTGKTFALAQRYVKLLLTASEPPEYTLRSILAITFTNKATLEMKQRIIELIKSIALNDFSHAQEKENILSYCGIEERIAQKKALRIMDGIIRHYSFFQVNTIDSFINALLLSCSYKIERTAHFTIQRDYRAFAEYCLDMVIEKAYTDTSVATLLQDFIQHYLFVENRTGWFPRNDMLHVITSLFTASNRYGALYHVSGISAEHILKKKKNLHQLIKKLFTNMPPAIFASARSAIEGFVNENTEQFDMAALPKVFTRPDIPLKKGTICTSHFKQQWETIVHEITSLAEYEAFGVYDPYLVLFAHFMAFFKKSAQGEDVVFLEELNRTAQMIVGQEGVSVAELYYRLAARFKHYLIDEFQDTSVLQWRNMLPLVEETLANGGTLFYVGDKKQAIYRFRGGEALLFDHVADTFASHKPIKTALNKNWRSQKAIVEFVNNIFSEANLSKGLQESGMAEHMGSIADVLNIYRDACQSYEEHATGGYVHIEYIEEQDAEERHELVKEKLIKLLRTLLNRFFAGDIAVLVPDNNDVERITLWLLEEAVPVESEKTMNVLENRLVKELLAFLTFLNSPVDSVGFAAFITGDIFEKVSGNTKDQMREFIFNFHRSLPNNEERYLYIHFRQTYPNLWKSFCADFFKNVGMLSPYELIISIYQCFNILHHFPLDQIYLMKFLELVKDAEDEQGDVGEFLSFCEQAPLEDVYVNSGESNAIKILTMHKAKGLEFPVVIIPYLGIDITPGNGDIGDNSFVVVDETLRLVRITSLTRVYSSKLQQIYEQAYRKACIDELNVLYVALTRAMYELYMVIPRKSKTSLNKARFFIPHHINEYGAPAVYTRKKHEDPHLRVNIPPSELQNWISLLKDEFLGTDTIRNRNAVQKGNILHDILAHIKSTDDRDIAPYIRAICDQILQHYPSYTIDDYQKIIEAIVSAPHLKHIFYVPEGTVFCEQDIITPAGDTKRIDRMIVKKEEVIIVDYKSSREYYDTYVTQIKEYMALVRDLYPAHRIQGFLLFMDDLSLEEMH